MSESPGQVLWAFGFAGLGILGLVRELSAGDGRSLKRRQVGRCATTPSLLRRGQVLARWDKGKSSLAGSFRSRRSASSREFVSTEVARRRGASRVPQMCPECVRVFSGQTTTKRRFAGTSCKPSDGLEPSTPSLPWRFPGVTRVHARSSATRFLLQIRPFASPRMRRETSRVSFLLCPFCVRVS
jgi:hypothetical protein